MALEVWSFEVEQPAVVLGSAQSDDVVDVVACRRAGVEVVRRRSGGGAVLLEPGAIVWFDVIVPAARLRAEGVGDDVSRSMVWLGAHVVAGLDALGLVGVSVHAGRMVTSRWSTLVCFAGLGPGEVVLDGHKLVGISQRRTVPARGSSAPSTLAGRPDGSASCSSPGRPTSRQWPPCRPTSRQHSQRRWPSASWTPAPS